MQTAWNVGVPLLVVLVATETRVRQWAAGRSFWLDEALLSDNVVRRGFGDLAGRPLLHGQAAPVGWLWLQRALVDVFGTDERVLRVVPLLAGLLTLLLVWDLARRLLPHPLVPVAVLVAGTSPSLLYYATEAKQYSSDATVCVLLVVLALRVPTTGATGRQLALLSVTGAIAVWFSFPALFVLAGLSVVLVLRPWLEGRRGPALGVAVGLLPWVVSFGVAYVSVLRPLHGSEVLNTYWGYTFPHGPNLPGWFGHRWVDLARSPLRLRPALVLPLLVVGTVLLLRRTRWQGGLALAVVPVATTVAALSVYPFASRLALWLVPLAALVLASVLPDSLQGWRTGWLLVGSALLTVLLVPAAQTVLPQTVRVEQVEELRPVLQQVAAERQPGDLVLVDIAAAGAFNYYADRLGVKGDGVVLFSTRKDKPCQDDQARATAHVATDRIWLVFSHQLVDKKRLGSRGDLLTRLVRDTSITEHLSADGAEAFLLDPAGEPVLQPPNVAPNPLRCLQVVRTTGTP